MSKTNLTPSQANQSVSASSDSPVSPVSKPNFNYAAAARASNSGRPGFGLNPPVGTSSPLASGSSSAKPPPPSLEASTAAARPLNGAANPKLSGPASVSPLDRKSSIVAAKGHNIKPSASSHISFGSLADTPTKSDTASVLSSSPANPPTLSRRDGPPVFGSVPTEASKMALNPPSSATVATTRATAAPSAPAVVPPKSEKKYDFQAFFMAGGESAPHAPPPPPSSGSSPSPSVSYRGDPTQNRRNPPQFDPINFMPSAAPPLSPCLAPLGMPNGPANGGSFHSPLSGASRAFTPGQGPSPLSQPSNMQPPHQYAPVAGHWQGAQNAHHPHYAPGNPPHNAGMPGYPHPVNGMAGPHGNHQQFLPKPHAYQQRGGGGGQSGGPPGPMYPSGNRSNVHHAQRSGMNAGPTSPRQPPGNAPNGSPGPAYQHPSANPGMAAPYWNSNSYPPPVPAPYQPYGYGPANMPAYPHPSNFPPQPHGQHPSPQLANQAGPPMPSQPGPPPSTASSQIPGGPRVHPPPTVPPPMPPSPVPANNSYAPPFSSSNVYPSGMSHPRGPSLSYNAPTFNPSAMTPDFKPHTPNAAAPAFQPRRSAAVAIKKPPAHSVSSANEEGDKSDVVSTNSLQPISVRDSTQLTNDSKIVSPGQEDNSRVDAPATESLGPGHVPEKARAERREGLAQTESKAKPGTGGKSQRELRDQDQAQAKRQVLEKVRLQQEAATLDEKEPKLNSGRNAIEKAEAEAKEAAERQQKERVEREAKEQAERLAKQKAELEVKERAEREAKEEAERDAKQKAEKEISEKAVREAKEKSEREAKEKSEREAKEKSEREEKKKSEQEAKEKFEREAKEKFEREAKEKFEREASELASRNAREQAEQDVKRNAERETTESAKLDALGLAPSPGRQAEQPDPNQETTAKSQQQPAQESEQPASETVSAAPQIGNGSETPAASTAPDLAQGDVLISDATSNSAAPTSDEPSPKSDPNAPSSLPQPATLPGLPSKPVNGVCMPSSGGAKNRPSPIDVVATSQHKRETSNASETASALPSALLSARKIEDLGQISYPENIQSPRSELNTDATPGKFRYDRAFLLQFMEVCKSKPAQLPDLDSIGMVDIQSAGTHPLSRTQSTGVQRRNTGQSPAGSRGPSGSLTPSAGPMSMMGPAGIPNRAGPGAVMPMFAAGGNRTSEERFLQSSRPTLGAMPIGSGLMLPGRPTGQMSRSPSSNALPGVMSSGPRDASRRSGRGSRRDGGSGLPPSTPAYNSNLNRGMPLQSMFSMETAVPLQSSANSWAASRSAQLEEDSPQMVNRKVKALLNKLTLDKFESISDQVISWANKSEKEQDGRILRQVIALIFEKATDEAHWSEMYAKLCRKLMEKLSPLVQDDSVLDTNGNKVHGGQLFRKYLLNRCQEDYERGWTKRDELAAAAAGKAADDAVKQAANLKTLEEAEAQGKEAPVKEAEILSDEYYAAQKAKRQGLGLVRFIGELFKLSMLTERIMHECIKKLLSNVDTPEEEDIESLCRLMMTVGEMLDHEKAISHMNVYFQRMSTMVDNSNLSSRIRFMVQDVIETRLNGWVGRNVAAGPKLISQIHQEAAQAAAEQSRQSQANKSLGKMNDLSRGGSRGGRNRDQIGGPTGDGWLSVGGSGAPPPRPSKAGDLTQFGKLRDTSSSGRPTFGPSNVFANRGKLKDGKLGLERAEPAVAVASNPFAALGGDTGDGSSMSNPVVLPKSSLSEVAPAGRPRLNLAPRTLPLPGKGETEAAEKPKVPVEPAEAKDDPDVTDDVATRQVQTRVEEFFNVRSISEAIESFSSLVKPRHHQLVQSLVEKVLHRKEVDVILTASLLKKLSDDVLSKSILIRAFTPVVEQLDDTAVDARCAYEYCAKLIKASQFSEQEVRQFAEKMDTEDLENASKRLVDAYLSAKVE